MVALFDDDPLDDAEIEAIGEAASFIKADVVAMTAARTLTHAWNLHVMKPEPEVRAAALLNYFKVLEGIAVSLPKGKVQDKVARQEEVLTDLQAELLSSKTRSRVAAVKTANDRLNRISTSFANLRIEKAAKVLGLEESWRLRALELHRFRNQELGHGGTSTESNEIEAWLDYKAGAPYLARHALAAYIRWKRNS